MGRIVLTIIFLTLLTLPALAKEISDADIKQMIIEQSVESYSGSCACPYSKDRAGRSCGGRSAYSKPGGASPICYPEDVTPEMMENFRKNNS